MLVMASEDICKKRYGIMDMPKKRVNGDKISETNSGGPLSPSSKLMLSK
jgi:hypothetical protein